LTPRRTTYTPSPALLIDAGFQVLSHSEILRCIERGEIVLDPFTPELVKRNSYVLRLGGQFRRITTNDVLDICDPDVMARNAGETFDAPDVEINSTSLVLASSFERVSLAPDLVGVLSGITNVARLGTLVHATSEFVNAGYGWGHPGRVIFELATVGGLRVRLYRVLPICHIAFFRMAEASSFSKPSARTGQDSPGESDLFRQFGHLII
jgi:dCTP deaminase